MGNTGAKNTHYGAMPNQLNNCRPHMVNIQVPVPVQQCRVPYPVPQPYPVQVPVERPYPVYQPYPVYVQVQAPVQCYRKYQIECYVPQYNVPQYQTCNQQQSAPSYYR